ncbi:MAG: hypothetical protein IJO63_00555 [Bacilli bacterium]|nr:hypothetical protein [Bacilli bacterium]
MKDKLKCHLLNITNNDYEFVTAVIKPLKNHEMQTAMYLYLISDDADLNYDNILLKSMTISGYKKDINGNWINDDDIDEIKLLIESIKEKQCAKASYRLTGLKKI